MTKRVWDDASCQFIEVAVLFDGRGPIPGMSPDGWARRPDTHIDRMPTPVDATRPRCSATGCHRRAAIGRRVCDLCRRAGMKAATVPPEDVGRCVTPTCRGAVKLAQWRQGVRRCLGCRGGVKPRQAYPRRKKAA